MVRFFLRGSCIVLGTYAVVMGSVVLAESPATPLGLSAAPASTSMDEQWEKVSAFVEVSREHFAEVREVHRNMLANLADAIRRVEAAGGSPLVPSVCFSPGTPPETMRLFAAFTEYGRKFQGADNTRWAQTFTNGGGLQQGDPTHLRISFVPDGLALVDTNFPGFGEPNTPSNLFASFNANFASTATWKALFQSVFDAWAQRAGLSYTFDAPDDGAPFPTAAGANGRGDIRIGGHTIDGPGAGILAYNYGPDFGDMVIDTGNTADAFAASAANNFRLLRNTISHEHGHGLGFAHVCPLNNAIVMEPIVPTAFDHSAEDDIRHANRKYGDPREKNGGNDSVATASVLGELTIGSGNAGDYLSIDSVSDADFYRVTTTAPRVVTITLAPTGNTYQEGPQNTPNPPSDPNGCNTSAVTTTNGRAVMNLNLQLLAGDGTTVLETANTQGLGQDEVISNRFFPGNGTFYVRVFTNDSVSVNPSTQVQMYSLSFASQAATLSNLRIVAPSGNVEENRNITLTAAYDGTAPAGFVWRKNGSPISTVTGDTLAFLPVTLADTGFYTVEADDGSKAIIVSQPFYLNVVPEGSLPAAGMLGLGVVAALCLVAGVRRLRG